MHGPTRIFWANLRPFAPQLAVGRLGERKVDGARRSERRVAEGRGEGRGAVRRLLQISEAGAATAGARKVSGCL